MRLFFSIFHILRLYFLYCGSISQDINNLLQIDNISYCKHRIHGLYPGIHQWAMIVPYKLNASPPVVSDSCPLTTLILPYITSIAVRPGGNYTARFFYIMFDIHA